MERIAETTIEPYGTTTKDKLYATLECLTNHDDYLTGIFWTVPFILTAGIAILPVDYFWKKAVDYRMRRERQNGVRFPWVSSVGLADIAEIWRQQK